ncbi:LmrA/YxaF family transcription factor [Mycobacterium lacus]|uniref:Transcriptional regulator LmrA/YxaF-like C-terminal domain-containing protein n=1 Tax=Mycobacterium lacus TaxID=169765 RepID=A0A7I7NIA0_9MYCO|nr:hypothetical protein [Mycobacterium lacus]BBX96168.1 hypothetical protein MLAC_14620 [Mycobacterium lacus]
MAERDVKIAKGHHQRPHQRLPGRSDRRVGHLAPCVARRRWIDLLAAGLTGDQRDGCPIEPIATESVNASPEVRAASARAFAGWCAAIGDRLRLEGWPPAEAEQVGIAVISLIEGALILSRVAGDTAALDAAKPAARALLRRQSG